MNKDKILVNQLELSARIGWTAEERAEPQQIVLNLTLELDISEAARTKDLNSTVCYAAYTNQLAVFVGRNEWTLAEELGEAICQFTLEQCPLVRNVSVQIRKFTVPHTSWVGVEISRTRAVQ